MKAVAAVLPPSLSCLIADHAPVILWTARPDTTLDFLNATAVEFSGMPLEQLLNEGWLNAGPSTRP